MPPGIHDVELFELGRRRQHDIGVARGIGDELLADHGEQILAGKAPQHLVLLRCDHCGVGVVDEQRADLAVELAEQRRSQPPLVENRRALGDPVGPAEHVPVERKRPDRHMQYAAAAMAPRADERGQAGHGAHRVAARGIALDGDAHPDDRGLGGGEFAGQGPDIAGGKPGDPGHPVRVEAGRAGFQILVADCVVLDIVAVDQVLGDDHVDHAERERRVGAGPDREMPVRLPGGAGGDRIDDHDPGAAALRLGDERPVMQIGADRVDRPQHDVSRMDEALRVHRRSRAAGHEERRDGGGIAERALRHRRPHLVEERIARVQPVQDPFGAEIAVRQDRGATVAVDDFAPAPGNLPQRLVPGNRLERPRPLGAGAAQRGKHPVLAVHPVLVVVHLDAKPAAGERVVRVAPHRDRPAVAHRRQHRAGIGTIVRTGAEHRLLHHASSSVPGAARLRRRVCSRA